MSQDYFRSPRHPSVSDGYRILRGLVRLWISVLYPKMRVLAAEVAPETAAALFVVAHPATFIEILFLVAASDRQLHCLVSQSLIRGPLRKCLSRGLGMIPYEKGGEVGRRAVETSCNILGNLGSVAVFTEFQSDKTGEPARLASTAAAIALEAESRHANQLDLLVVPVHLCLPVAGLERSEMIAFFDRRIPPQTYMLPGKPLEERRQALGAALEEAYRKNVFSLPPEDVRRFMADLEEVLLADLREDFASRANWKQKVEDFELSGFVRDWLEQINFLHPAQLIALREMQNAHREALRQASLEGLEVEAAGPRAQAVAWKALGWIETLAGFPAAFYGLANHLPAALLLRGAGLIKKQGEMNRAVLWISRGAVLLAFYAAQVLLTDHFLGRAAAGYYAVSLPISALYLWRYAWLLKHRSRLLILKALIPRRLRQARRKRREFLRELNAARDAYVESLGLVH